MKISAKPVSEERGKLAGLILLFVLLAGVVYYYYFRPTEDDALTSNPATGAGALAGAGAQASLPSPLKFGELESVNGLPAAGRNPFRFGAPPPPPAQPPRPTPPPVQAPTTPVITGPPPVPPPPIISLKFVGLVHMPSGKRVASLSDGKGIFQGVEGDVIDGRFRIVKIGVESIVMEYLDGRGRQTIQLRGSGTEMSEDQQ